MRGMLLLTVAWCLGCAMPPVMMMPATVDSGTPAVEQPLPCLQVRPAEIDFGEVETASGGFRVVEVRNNSNMVRVLRSARPAAPFNVSPPLQSIELRIPGPGSRNIEVQFLPTDALLHLGSIELSGGPGCEVTIPLRGLGSGSVKFMPELLEYGFLEPGQHKTLEVQLVNTRRDWVTVTSLRLDSPQGLGTFTGNLPSQFQLPPMSSTSFSFTASPPIEGFFRAELGALTPFGGTPSAHLRVVGGVPVAEISPQAIEMPNVGLAIVSRGKPNFSERVLRVRNLGTSTHPAASLEIPVVRVESLDGGSIDELTFLLPERLSDGLSAGESAEVLLRLTPRAVGSRSYRLTLFANDPVRPEQVVTLEANVVPLAPCTLRVQPETELLLEAMPDGHSQGTLSFINEGTTRCIVDDVRLSEDTPASFSIRNAATQLAVEPGATETITIDGPRTLFENIGQLGFHVFKANSARQLMTLRAPP